AFVLHRLAPAVARRTGGARDASSTTATWACPLESDGPLPHLDVTTSLALGAHGLGAGIAARPVTGFTQLRPINGHLRRYPADGVQQTDLERRLHICPRLRAAPATGAKEVAEDVFEIFVPAKAAAAGRRFGSRLPPLRPLRVRPRPFRVETRLQSLHAELVVHFTLLGIAQDIVGMRDLFETFLGLFVAGVDVGMIASSQLAIRLAYRIGACITLDPERGVQVCAVCRGHASGRCVLGESEDASPPRGYRFMVRG